MVYARGQASDFDAWEALGNPGWGLQDVLATYRRMEDHDRIAATAPVVVANPYSVDRQVAALRHALIPFIKCPR